MEPIVKSGGDIFLKLYRNKVIRKEINEWKSEKPKCFSFNSRESLLQFEDREFLLNAAINFDEELEVGDIPSSVKILSISAAYRKEIKANVIPNGVFTLGLPYSFDQELVETLIPSIIEFDQDITQGSIPSSVETLSFLNKFSKPIGPNVLPHSLKSLVLGFGFNQPITGILPQGLLELSFSYSFNQPIFAGDLPTGLKSLSLGASFDQPLDGVLPDALESLVLFRKYSHAFNLPAAIKHLEIDNIAPFIQANSAIPSSVTEFSIAMPNISLAIPVGFIPSSVINLTIRSNFSQPITQNVIPASVETITFRSRGFDQTIVIPPTVKKVIAYNETKNRLARNRLIPSTATFVYIRSLKSEDDLTDEEDEYTDEENEEEN
ncbi:hypothetical protein DICPUDRAFT_150823 [Dictyostelium purpureum]|uniref:FNIP repeat-containing protein n=1 Tax=Dictyostelium purpureum TaxID=5786 RepID=F0ZHC4_DICPU|nr:uncharacterized protein DICPUDRAFT_150823 [Dictyostelium purpureum]EGC36646.1 hypothetical protein DICPUDRAFT_150823 [Dictyostelium purpureum]|eukprot:XP_003286814.1 hypothetical protein DICPUDRAFT_150823 [Dictyostelium purpureum]